MQVRILKKISLLSLLLLWLLQACSETTSSVEDDVNANLSSEATSFNPCDLTDPTSGAVFCKDETGTYVYYITVNGETVWINNNSSSSSITDTNSLYISSSSLDVIQSSSSIEKSCTSKEPSFTAEGISYYYNEQNLSYYYYDSLCTPIFLTAASSSSSEKSSSSTIISVSSSSNIISSASSSASTNGLSPTITYSESEVIVTNNNNCIEVTNGITKITCGGDYYFSGSRTEGQILVESADLNNVYLYLQGLILSNSTDAPLYVRNAEKVLLVLADNTVNTFTDGKERTVFYDGDTTKACIYAKDDLTIKGNGKLNVTGNFNNGIHTSNDLRFKDAPTIVVSAVNNAIKGKGSVEFGDETPWAGNIEVTSTAGDGIKSDEGEDTANGETYNLEKGFIWITGGTFKVTTAHDAIDAYNYIKIDNSPTITIKTGQGATGSTNSTYSYKGLKSDSLLIINGGTIDINAQDDCIHSSGDITIAGGTMTLASADDAIHSDKTLNINDGNISVSKSYEGFEAYIINLNGGTTSIVASDDGWNAAGGDGSGTATGGSTSFPSWGGGGGGFSSSTGTLNVKGGYHFVKAGGDGLDSNGDFNISGGTTIVVQTGGGGNGILDMGDGSGYKMTHTGGVVLGVGTAQMFVTPNSGTYISSTSLGASQNTMICIANSSGQILAAFKAPLSAAAGIYMDNNISGHKFYVGGTFSGSLDANGFASTGTISGATQK